MKKALLATGKALASVLIAALLATVCFSVSPIYDFAPARPFSGPDIFNPYAALPTAINGTSATGTSVSCAAIPDSSAKDSAISWKRANFHTHTRVDGPLNECAYSPAEALEAYRELGYDILTFSNHNELTAHPCDTALQVNVYEHGYGLFKYHKLVFGSARVRHFDHLLPLLASQKQWQLDFLHEDADFIQLNHPFRTGGTSEYLMSRLEGYEIMELDSHVTTSQEYWDWALGAGHYSFGLANDDCHDISDTGRIAIRSNWLYCPSGRYEDIRNTLLSGAYYSMRVPDYGAGDRTMKKEGNRNLPRITDIGLRDSTIYMSLSEAAALIEVTGQDRRIIDTLRNACSISTVMHHDQPYARITAYFDDGAVLYTNPFARYDKTESPAPFRKPGHRVNVALTLLFNAALAAIAVLLLCVLRFLWGSGRRCRG